jgi:lysophospholipase L1-like esterase
MKRYLIAAVASVCCASFALMAGAAPAAPTSRAAPVTPGSDYLALGDSVTFGYMEQQVVPAPNYHNAVSFPGYPGQLGAELRLKVANAACPGETSSSLIDTSAQSNGCENSVGHPHVGYRLSYPLHVHYTGSQLAYALAYLKGHRNVRLVSLMIGANDFFACVSTTKDGCSSTSERNALLTKIRSNVRKILGSVRNTAHYGGQIAIVSYYSLDYSSAATTALSVTLNKAVDGAAKPYRVVIADGFGEFKAAASHSGGNPCKAGLLTQVGPSSCGVHPSYAGQALLAQALHKAIRL